MGWVSVPVYCLTATDGDCTGAFSTRHFGPMQSTDFYLSNTARRAISSGGCWIPLNNSVIIYSSKYMTVNVVIDPIQFSIKIHGSNHHEQHVPMTRRLARTSSSTSWQRCWTLLCLFFVLTPPSSLAPFHGVSQSHLLCYV